MKKVLKIALFITLLFSLYGCPSDSGSNDEDVFEVGYEMFDPVFQDSDGKYNISNGGFRAYFRASSDPI